MGSEKEIVRVARPAAQFRPQCVCNQVSLRGRGESGGTEGNGGKFISN